MKIHHVSVKQEKKTSFEYIERVCVGVCACKYHGSLDLISVRSLVGSYSEFPSGYKPIRFFFFFHTRFFYYQQEYFYTNVNNNNDDDDEKKKRNYIQSHDENNDERT